MEMSKIVIVSAAVSMFPVFTRLGSSAVDYFRYEIIIKDKNKQYRL